MNKVKDGKYIDSVKKKLADKANENATAYRLLLALCILEHRTEIPLPRYAKVLIEKIINGTPVCIVESSYESQRLLRRARDYTVLRPVIKKLFYPKLGRPISLKCSGDLSVLPLKVDLEKLTLDTEYINSLKWLDENCYLVSGNLQKLTPTV